MSSPERRKEKERERARQEEIDDIERRRLANRSMYEKIEEASTISDVREILHEFVEKLGM